MRPAVHSSRSSMGCHMLAVAVLTSTPRDALITAGADVVVDEVGDVQVDALLARLT